MERFREFFKDNIIVIILIVIILVIAVFFWTKNENKQNIEKVLEQAEADISLNEEKNEMIEEKKEIAIHITGEVKKTGVIYLKEGARIIDAIKQAGGATKNADLSKVNLAYVLQDGQKLYIANKKDRTNEYIIEDGGQNIISETNTKKENNKNNQININTASKEQLQALSGVGPSLAQKIIEYRNSNGKFKKKEDIKNVSGIGENKYRNIKDNICI